MSSVNDLSRTDELAKFHCIVAQQRIRLEIIINPTCVVRSRECLLMTQPSDRLSFLIVSIEERCWRETAQHVCEFPGKIPDIVDASVGTEATTRWR